jgi:Predicted membrane protein (DUF2339)/Protein of unknown function (DUF3999)
MGAVVPEDNPPPSATCNSLLFLSRAGAFWNPSHIDVPGNCGGATVWMPGALIGGLLAYQIYSDAWAIGAVVGALAGLVIGRTIAKPPGEQRLAEVEARLAEVPDRIDWLDRRVAELERSDRPAPKAESVTPRRVGPPPPEPVPAQAPIAFPQPVPPPVSEPIERAARPAEAVKRERRSSQAVDEWPIWQWPAGGNTIVRVGVVVLFFGGAFLLKYAHERFHLPVELRLAGAAVGALVLLVIGWRLRERRPGYALTLQGGGIGILYLVIFAAFRLYNLLPPVLAFALLVAVAALSAMIAVAQDALALAVLGTAGGFFAPILASTGGGSHVVLFSYYAVLNAGILAIAWFRAWRVLNLVGFAFTFAIGTLWGLNFYRPEHFASTEPFLALFFALYLAIPMLFARRRASDLERYVDGSLVFGVPLVTFGLQVGLVREIEYGAAWSALTLGAVYLGLATIVFGSRGETLRLLAEAFLALGVVFGSLAIPLALDARWTSAAWALEGAAILWVGVRQQRLSARVFGVALQCLAGDPDSQPARSHRARRHTGHRALARRITAARPAVDRDGAARSALRSARRAPVRVGERRAPARPPPLGRSPIHARRDAARGHRADGVLDPVDPRRARQHGHRDPTQPAGGLDRRRGTDGRRGGQALHDRPVQRRHGAADRVVRRRRRVDARPRLLLAGAAALSARGPMKTLIAALLLVPALAGAEQPRDFAYGIPIQISGQDALQQLELPRAVYEGVVHADLADLRVFNGAGEVVAYAFRPRVTSTKEKPSPTATVLFPIRSDEPTGVEGVELHLERRGDRTVVDLRTPQGRPALGAKLVGYLADARAFDKPIRAVVLELPPGDDQVFTRVTIEASDDLRQWTPLASGAPVVRLASAVGRLEQLRIEVPPRRAKYLRVSWPGRGGPLELTALAVEPGDAVIAAPRQWTQVTGVVTKDKPGEYAFDLGGQFPVDRLRMGLPQQNTVASVQLLSRAKPDDPWRYVTTATAYRLVRDGDDLTSADIEVGAVSNRYWLARVDQRGGGLGGGSLGLSAGWVPHRLVFASRGPGPFQLAYGSRDAKSSGFPIATLVPGYQGEDELGRAETRAGEPTIVIGAAQALGEPQRLGGDAVTRERVDWKRWALWGSLVLGVAVLGWMALRLGRQMARPA